MPAQLNQGSGFIFLLATVEMSIISASTYQRACALEADRKQRHVKEAAALSAGYSHKGRDWLLKHVTCYDTG